MKTEQGTLVWLQSGEKHRYTVDLKVKVKQVDRAGVEMAGTKSSSSAIRKRIQKQPAGNPCEHEDMAWGDLQHAWRAHGSGARAMGAGLGGVSLITWGKAGGGWLDPASPQQVN